jgi:hypothetical protein
VIEHEDVIVYAHPNGADYVALIGDQWYRWPADHDGWRARVGCPASTADLCWELPPKLADLALRLSGVTQ